jgi:hypothetical protein
LLLHHHFICHFSFQAGQIAVAQIQQEKDFQFMCGSALSYCRGSVMIATEGSPCEACGAKYASLLAASHRQPFIEIYSGEKQHEYSK